MCFKFCGTVFYTFHPRINKTLDASNATNLKQALSSNWATAWEFGN
jgi:hypothetical protein